MQIIENMRHAPHWLTRRIGALGLGAMVAASALLPGTTALAAPQAGCGTSVSCIIQFGDARIAERQTALTKLSGAITTQANAGHITSGQASNLQSDVSANANGLAALKTKLDAEITAAAAVADVKLIYLHFRIFAVVLPRDYHIIWLDVLVNIDAKLRTLQPKIETVLDKASKLNDTDNDGDVAAMNAAYADLKAQLTAAEGQIDGAQGLIPSLTPAAFNDPSGIYKTDWTDFVNDIHSAHTDIKAAVADLHKIVAIAKELNAEQKLPAGSAPAHEP
jgi:hypothetical protein